jgi:competence protein ComEA
MKRAMAVMAMGLLVAGAAESAERHKRGAVKLTGVVNLNQASVAQLDLLPGVGDKAAKRIIAHREKSPFKRVEELVKVKGFGKKKFDKLKPHLSIIGPTTLVVLKDKADPGGPNHQARAPAPAR